MKATYDKKGQTVIINLTIVECKLANILVKSLSNTHNKSNHSGM